MKFTQVLVLAALTVAAVNGRTIADTNATPTAVETSSSSLSWSGSAAETETMTPADGAAATSSTAGVTDTVGVSSSAEDSAAVGS
ncbi:hypothetical protein PF002_g31843, partial [Phytophthora fragariae]